MAGRQSVFCNTQRIDFGPQGVAVHAKQLRRLDRALGPGERSEHDGDEGAPAALGGGDDVETGGADEAGLHAANAGIATDEPIGVVQDLLAE